MNVLWGVLFGLAWPPLSGLFWALFYRRWLRSVSRGFAADLLKNWTLTATIMTVLYLAARAWSYDSGTSVSLAVALGAWWWRKRRDRAKAWLGAKSKALVDALTARMPKPVVLRPGLGGAS